MKQDQDIKVFRMIRESDTSGVSGTGCILEGVVFHNGQVVCCWRSDVEGAGIGEPSIGIYPTWHAFETIHITSHPHNGTRIEWQYVPRHTTKKESSL